MLASKLIVLVFSALLAAHGHRSITLEVDNSGHDEGALDMQLLNATQEEGSAEMEVLDEAVNSTGCGVYRSGERVAVFSRSSNVWCPGSVGQNAINGVQVHYTCPGGRRLTKTIACRDIQVALRREVTRGCGVYRTGEYVDVFSRSTNIWCKGSISGQEPNGVQVRYTCPGGQRLTKTVACHELAVALRKHQAVIRGCPRPYRAYRTGEQVDVFSRSTNVWCRGSISEKVINGLQVRYSCPGGMQLTKTIVCPDLAVALRKANRRACGRFRKNQHVHVFSRSQNFWCSGSVSATQPTGVQVRYTCPGGAPLTKFVTCNDAGVALRSGGYRCSGSMLMVLFLPMLWFVR